MNSASPTPRNGTSVLPDDGGNLARVISNALSTRTGQFLFPEQFEQFAAQIGHTGWVSPPGSPASGAASGRGSTRSSRLPFIKINHVTHVPVSLCASFFSTEAFA